MIPNPDNLRAPSPTSRLFPNAALAAVGILLIFLVWRAATIRIDYYDAYEVLLNSRAIATGGGEAWHVQRPIGFPLALSPYFFIERLGSGEHFAWMASHLTAVAFWLALLIFSYKLFRPRLGSLWALVACLLLAINPLLLHFAVAVKEDVAAAALVAAGLWAYQNAVADERPGQYTRRFLPAAIFFALACAFRYNLIASLGATIALYEILRCQWNSAGIRRLAIRGLILGGCSAGIFWALAIFVYSIVGRASPVGAPRMLIEDVIRIKNMNNVWFQPTWVNGWLIFKMMTWPMVLCAIFGMARAARGKIAGAALHGLWLVCFLSVQTFLIGYKDARYLFPALISLYFFAALGIQGVWQNLPRAWMRPLGVGLLMAWPAWLAVVECGKLLDPIYATTFENDVCSSAASLSQGHRLIWVGSSGSLHPADYVFDQADNYTYIYHFQVPSVEYYTRLPVIRLDHPMLMLPRPGEPIFVDPNHEQHLQSGDVLIINPEPNDYITSTMPPRLLPMFVQRVQILELKADPQSPGEYRAAGSAAVIQLTRDSAGRCRLRGHGLPPVVCSIAVDSPAGPVHPIIHQSLDGNLDVWLPAGVLPPESPPRFILDYYDAVRMFPIPGGGEERAESRQ